MTRTILMAALSAPLLSAAPAMAASNVSCSVPNHVVCTVTSDKGLREVTFVAGTPFGNIAVVDEDYRGCPKSVQVAYDSAYNVKSTQIVECSGIVAGGLKLKTN